MAAPELGSQRNLEYYRFLVHLALHRSHYVPQAPVASKDGNGTMWN